MARTSTTDKGVSLARGPALIIGSILLAFGLLAFLADGSSPTDGFPDGTVSEIKTIFGIGVNDWTAFFTAVAGGLLLFGAAQHLLAKTMSLVVGLALGACSVIALVDGDDVLGLAGANGWTKLGWGAAAAALLINALLPRKGGKDKDKDHDAHREPAVAPRRETVAAPREPVATRSETVSHDDRVLGRDDRTIARDDRTLAHDDRSVTKVEERGTGRFDRDGDRGLDPRGDGSVPDDRLRDQR